MADTSTNAVPNVSPTGTPVLPQVVVIVVTSLVAVAGVLLVIPGMPPVVSGIASAVIAIGAVFGIASPGIRKSDAAK